MAEILNPNFGISPVVADWNGDGWPDVALANLNGALRVFINRGLEEQGAGPRSVKVRLRDSARSLGRWSA